MFLIKAAVSSFDITFISSQADFDCHVQGLRLASGLVTWFQRNLTRSVMTFTDPSMDQETGDYELVKRFVHLHLDVLNKDLLSHWMF